MNTCAGCKYYEVCGDDSRVVPCEGKEMTAGAELCAGKEDV